MFFTFLDFQMIWRLPYKKSFQGSNFVQKSKPCKKRRLNIRRGCSRHFLAVNFDRQFENEWPIGVCDIFLEVARCLKFSVVYFADNVAAFEQAELVNITTDQDPVNDNIWTAVNHAKNILSKSNF